ncbi:MAG: hypothetical protein PVJ67_00470 [Candidatus Pacearchaeota archaeon]|jgi:hypothetical protein
MQPKHSLEQLYAAEDYFSNLKLEDIPQEINPNSTKEFFLLKNMTGIFADCSRELLDEGLEKVQSRITKEIFNMKRRNNTRNLSQIPGLILRSQKILESPPIYAITNSTNEKSYENSRRLIAQQHIELLGEFMKAYNSYIEL